MDDNFLKFLYKIYSLIMTDNGDEAMKLVIQRDSILSLSTKNQNVVVSSNTNEIYDKYLKIDDEIKSTWGFVPLKIDDTSPLFDFLTRLLSIKIENITFEILIDIITKTIVSYYGCIGNDNSRNMIYVKQTEANEEDSNQPNYVSMKKFKNSNTALCTEKNALAHNLMMFSGLASHLIFGNLDIEGNSQKHVFTIVQNSGKNYILDFANPTFTIENEKLKNVETNLMQLSDDEYAKFIIGSGMIDFNLVHIIKNSIKEKEFSITYSSDKIYKKTDSLGKGKI